MDNVQSLPNEIWADIPGWEKMYAVSNMGRFYSYARTYAWNGTTKTTPGCLRSGNILDGYTRVGLSAHGKRKLRGLHTLIAETFLGPAPKGMECCHDDGNPQNNKLNNLYWGTHSENTYDSVKHGTHPQSRKTECPRKHPLTGDNVSVSGGKRSCKTCRRDRRREKYVPHPIERIRDSNGRYTK